MLNNNKPVIQNGFLLETIPLSDEAVSIQVGSQAWFTWLGSNQHFIYQGNAGHLTARREIRRRIGYWYGYRRLNGKLTKLYLGKSQELSQERLENACAQLARQTPLPLAAGFSGIIDTGLSSLPPSAISHVSSLESTASIPLTKIRPPALPQNPLSRSHLSDRINAPVTIIVAPGGFGKTTLLNEWRQSKEKQVAWVSLDEDDNHPLHFWPTVVAALQTIRPSLGQCRQSQMDIPSASALSTIVVNLTNDIIRDADATNSSQWIGLVLDNYHHIQDAEIHTSLQALLEHLPPAFKLVIASRTKPPLALGHLRAKGMVTELRTEDLRFSSDEGIAFLKQHIPGQQLAYSDMQILIKRTEGWITGLVLATCALTQLEDRSRILETFTGGHPLLREFFTDGVLQRLPPEVNAFLHKTSILKYLTGPLCNTVTGQSDGDEMLAQLCEANFFLEHLEHPGWYRYHELFAEMLRIELKEQSPAEIPQLHFKAAKWYRMHASPSEAIHHLLLSKSWEKAAALIEDVALSELEKSGEDSRLLRWLKQLPEEVVQRHKTLLVVYIRLARIALPEKEVDAFLARTEMNILTMPVSQKKNVLIKTLKEIKRIRHLWAADNQAALGVRTGSGDDTGGQMLDGILQIHRDYRIDLIKAEAKANEVYEVAKARGHLFSILMAGGASANLAFSQGHLRHSELVANKVLQQASELRHKLPEPASIALTALGGVYFERNQLAQAHQLLERAIDVDPNPSGMNESISMAILRSKIQSIQGDTDAAFATIQAIREVNSNRPSNIWLDQDLIAYQALYRLHQGDLTSAERLLGGGWEIDKQPFSAFVRASILVEQNRNVAAEEILRYLLNQYPHSFYWVPILRAQVMLATSLFNQQKINQARQVMAEAARIAAPEFFVRPFLSSNPNLSTLLSLVLSTENLNPGTRSFLKGVLTLLGHSEDLPGTHIQLAPMDLAIAASISPREQEILQSLSIGLSNREIAEEYYISSSTVKTHLENIFRKLGVSNRTQAIAQAQALGLIQILPKRA